MATLKIVAAPHAPDSTGADLNILQDELLGYTHRSVGWMMQTVFQDRLFDLLADPIEVRPFGAGETIQ